MGRLVEIYAAASGESVANDDVVALGARLLDLSVRGRAAHPGLELGDEAFVAHLGRCGAALDGALQVEDLYLAGACLAGRDDAIARLRLDSKTLVTRGLFRIRGAESICEEVEQRLWRDLFVGTGDGPKLATYAGRGALGSWIAVCAQRLALMMLRSERVEARARRELAAQRRIDPDDPETEAIKERYRAQFQRAVGAALSTLDTRDKTLYRMHLVDGLPLVHIAKVYAVHHATVQRWLAGAQARILKEAKRRLREELAVSSGEFDSIARLLVSQVDLDISRVLGERS